MATNYGSAVDSAYFVLGGLLTKSGQLTTNDIRNIQTAVGVPEPNGTFGPGTASAVMGYLNSHPDIAMRVSEAVRTSLTSQGQGASLDSLRTRFGSSALNAASTHGDTVQSLLAQPYGMSTQEIRHLQGELYRSGHYRPTGNELITRADTGAKVFTGDGTMGASLLNAVQSYHRAHPELVVRNPTILNHLDRIGASDELRHSLVLSGSGQRNYINTLIRGVDQNEISPINYALQTMLNRGGVGARPDGQFGPDDQRSVDSFRALRVSANYDPELEILQSAGATQLAASVPDPTSSMG